MAFQNLKPGDVRKFKYKDGNTRVGLILKVNDFYAHILPIINIVHNTTYAVLASDVAEVTATRLAPETREAVNNYWALYKQLNDTENQIDKLRAKSAMLREKLNKAAPKVSLAKDWLPKQEFNTAFWEALSPSVRARLERDKFRAGVTYSDTDKRTPTLEVCFRKEEHIKKYVREGEYSFVYAEYDGCLFTNSKDPNYKKMTEAYRKRSCSFKPIQGKGQAANPKIYCSLDIGDKNWLIFTEEVVYTFKYAPTKANAKACAKHIQFL